MKYIKEAEKLTDWLENHCGWEVNQYTKQCPKCLSRVHNTFDNYCAHCGTKLVDSDERHAGTNQLAEGLELIFKGD